MLIPVAYLNNISCRKLKLSSDANIYLFWIAINYLLFYNVEISYNARRMLWLDIV